MYRSTDRWSLVPSCFCKEALEKQEINLLSSGLQKRDFISVKDLAITTEKLVIDFESHKNKVINISSGVNYTIVEIANIVADLYKELYAEDCVVKIHSDEPKEGNKYLLDRTDINKLNLDFGDKNKIEEEIRIIFNLLN